MNIRGTRSVGVNIYTVAWYHHPRARCMVRFSDACTLLTCTWLMHPKSLGTRNGICLRAFRAVAPNAVLAGVPRPLNPPPGVGPKAKSALNELFELRETYAGRMQRLGCSDLGLNCQTSATISLPPAAQIATPEFSSKHANTCTAIDSRLSICSCMPGCCILNGWYTLYEP